MNLNVLVNSLAFSIAGLIIMFLSFFLFDKLTPYNLWKEICDKSNVALAIVVGSVVLGIAVIVGSAVHG